MLRVTIENLRPDIGWRFHYNNKNDKTYVLFLADFDGVDGHEEGDGKEGYSGLCPTCYGGEVCEAVPCRDEEDTMSRYDAVYGLAACHVEVVPDIVVRGVETAGPLEPEDAVEGGEGVGQRVGEESEDGQGPEEDDSLFLFHSE